ncbi:MAG TPA: hypothetical protein VFW75_12790 [Acetobacteraceae bacterium]|nr:hypothetical protein [Acetobacteraceae bacterium]
MPAAIATTGIGCLLVNRLPPAVATAGIGRLLVGRLPAAITAAGVSYLNQLVLGGCRSLAALARHCWGRGKSQRRCCREKKVLHRLSPFLARPKAGIVARLPHAVVGRRGRWISAP